MPVPRELTQPPGQKLIAYRDFAGRLEKLSTSPRVRIERLDTSAEGRGIYAVIIADEKVLPHADYYRKLSIALQRPPITHSTLSQRNIASRPALPAEMYYSAAVIGESFGHEASHVEALVELAEKLAWEDSEDVRIILSKLIVQIMPMMNPDGREMAVELWKAYPLAEDGAVAGNRYGFFINRDFLHLTQPEGRAVLKLYRDWHPLALYDTHEDAFLLGVVTPEVCWYPEDGVTTADLAPRNIQEIVSGFGKAIKAAWEARGYHYYPRDMFAYPMIGQSPDQPHRIATGNITGSMSLHGVPSLITESARTPGTQSWEDRIEQKVSAGIAVLKEVARDPDAIARTIYGNAQSVINTDDGFIIPKNQPEAGAATEMINILLQHEVAVYEIDTPQPAYVVPLAQAEAPLIRDLLASATSKLVAMPPAMGVQVMRAGAEHKNIPLKRVFEVPTSSLTVKNSITAPAGIAIPNTAEGIRLINRLWHVNLPVYWLTAPISTGDNSVPPGAFVVAGLPLKTLKTLASSLHLTVTALAAGTTFKGRLLRRPAAALYAGQGVDRPTPSPIGDIWWGLEKLEFDLTLLEAEQVNPEWLGRSNIFIVPEGNARDIVEGWHLSSRRSSEAWDLPGEPRGIGHEGVAAIHSFVEKGGAYLGFGSGGGLLATQEYAGLMNLTVLHHSLGTGRVLLRIADPSSPLIYGLEGHYDAEGQWQPGILPAMYDTETMSNVVGGPIFKGGEEVKAVAYYHSADCNPEERYMIRTELFAESEKGLAVAYQQVGKGQVTVVGVRPGFRAFWPYSFKLVSNAVFQSAAGEEQTVKLG